MSGEKTKRTHFPPTPNPKTGNRLKEEIALGLGQLERGEGIPVRDKKEFMALARPS